MFQVLDYSLVFPVVCGDDLQSWFSYILTITSEFFYDLNISSLFFLSAGRLPKNNGIPWRGDSCLHDGSTLSDVKGGLVGGYYDAGDNIKFHFPMAFSMTLLSWSVIEYGDKYKAIGEYNHITDIIKWGTDYLLRTFNSSATTITKMYSQVRDRKGNPSSATLLLKFHHKFSFI